MKKKNKKKGNFKFLEDFNPQSSGEKQDFNKFSFDDIDNKYMRNIKK